MAGVTWIGLVYYFHLVQRPFLKEADTSTRNGVLQGLLPRALFWFRWAALFTFLAGAALMGRVGFNTPLLIGASLGSFMFLNSWMVIYPHQKQIIHLLAASAAAGTPPPAVLAMHERVVSAASRANF